MASLHWQPWPRLCLLRPYQGPILRFHPAYTFNSVWELPLYFGLGVLSGLSAAFYIRLHHFTRDIFDTWNARAGLNQLLPVSPSASLNLSTAGAWHRLCNNWKYLRRQTAFGDSPAFTGIIQAGANADLHQWRFPRRCVCACPFFRCFTWGCLWTRC
ncbi:MAG: chloride channel protein [Planctomycetia bacterium]|nr:chloride channel protein [Planctomycetia bacterium]